METTVKTIQISKASFIANYSMISGPGKYEVKAGASNLVFDENLGKEKYIVNLKAIRASDAAKVQALFAGKQSIDITLLNGLTLSHNVIVNSGNESIPASGEMVEVQFDEVTTKANEVKLAATFMKVKKASRASSFASFLSEEATPELSTAELKAIA